MGSHRVGHNWETFNSIQFLKAHLKSFVFKGIPIWEWKQFQICLFHSHRSKFIKTSRFNVSGGFVFSLFWGSKITADGDCRHEIKRCLLLGRKVMTNLDSIFKSRDITLPTNVLSSQGYGFSCGHVWMWELDCEESWAPKKWCFWTWCWRRLWRVPWTARRSNQSILKEIRPGCSLEGMMLKLKLQYFGHLVQSVDSLEKTLMLGGIGGRRKRGWQRMRWLDGITDSMDVSLSEL